MLSLLANGAVVGTGTVEALGTVAGAVGSGVITARHQGL